MVVEGEDAVDVSRHIIGKTNPSEATPGSIRDLGLTVGRNVFMVLIQLNQHKERLIMVQRRN